MAPVRDLSAILQEVMARPAQVWPNTLWEVIWMHLDGVIRPSEIVYDLLQKYKVKAENALFRQGIDLAEA